MCYFYYQTYVTTEPCDTTVSMLKLIDLHVYIPENYKNHFTEKNMLHKLQQRVQ